MIVALDKDGNRIYANATERYKECFCLECGKPLVHKMGEIKAHHFAHKADSDCPYGKDKDSKSEWHIHMQELFPPESLEVRFKDEATREVYIADVYLESSKTVIEFQHSPIDIEKEFDGIWACATLLHVPMDELPVIMKKLHNALKENGALYASFKYGEGTTFRGERKFSDFTEKSIVSLFETAVFEIVSNIVGSDSRPGRESEKWVNVIGIAR